MKVYDYAANKHKLVDSTGRRLTTGLFEELADNPATAVFTLREWRKVYIDVADPTDYQAALCLIGDWDHWNLVAESPSFRACLERWRREVEIKLRSQAILEMVKQSRSPKGTQAAKWLAEAGFVVRDKRNKKNKEDEEQASKEANSKIAQDAKRLGLSLVKQG